VFGYQDDRAISLETPSDTLFTTVNAWKDSEARREASVRTYDALARKARASHVAGGRVFADRNVDVCNGTDVHGRPVRSHVTREIHEDEAAVVRRIFELRQARRPTDGRPACLLNEAGAPSPMPQQARRAGWSASSVRTVLFRELYRGVVHWSRNPKAKRVRPTASEPSRSVRVGAAGRAGVADRAGGAVVGGARTP
jgi:hypothetical protein